jgi:hypothetical protein
MASYEPTLPKPLILRCSQCRRLIARVAWETMKFPDIYRCCEAMDLQPAWDLDFRQ